MTPLQLTINNGLAQITLNRPDRFNSLNAELAAALLTALREVAENKSVHVVYLTGAGRAFCTGQDIGELTSDTPPGIDEILTERLNPIARAMRAMPQPIVAAVNGVAAGAGVSIALLSDVCLATESAKFIQAFVNVGLVPDTGSSWVLPRLIGRQRAAALMLTGEPVSAPEALQMGMIARIYPDDNFAEMSLAFARKLTALPARTLALIKQALDASAGNTLDEQLDLEDKLQQQAAVLPDYQEGIRAFIEKRKPEFNQ